MFILQFRDQAAKRLSKINEPDFSRLKKEIFVLQKNYFPAGKNCKKLHGKEKDLYRIRIGPYRVLYHVDHVKQIIIILRIFLRGEGY